VRHNRADQMAHNLVAEHIQALEDGMQVVAARPGNPAVAAGRPVVAVVRPAASDVASEQLRPAVRALAVLVWVQEPAQAGGQAQVPPSEPEVEALLVVVPGLPEPVQAWPSRPVQLRLLSWQRKTSRGWQFLPSS
jgi:hypothetical protein